MHKIFSPKYTTYYIYIIINIIFQVKIALQQFSTTKIKIDGLNQSN